MRKPSYGEETAQHLLQLTAEAGEHRTRVLATFVDLLKVSAVETIVVSMQNPSITQFLLEDEIALLRDFLKNALPEENRMN